MGKYIALEDDFLKRKIKDNSQEGLKYRYMLLSRMKTDCDYYLGNGNKIAKHLWAGNEKEHISAMRILFDAFSSEQKPVWLTEKMLNNYAKEMGV